MSLWNRRKSIYSTTFSNIKNIKTLIFFTFVNYQSILFRNLFWIRNFYISYLRFLSSIKTKNSRIWVIEMFCWIWTKNWFVTRLLKNFVFDEILIIEKIFHLIVRIDWLDVVFVNIWFFNIAKYLIIRKKIFK